MKQPEFCGIQLATPDSRIEFLEDGEFFRTTPKNLGDLGFAYFFGSKDDDTSYPSWGLINRQWVEGPAQRFKDMGFYGLAVEVVPTQRLLICQLYLEGQDLLESQVEPWPDETETNPLKRYRAFTLSWRNLTNPKSPDMLFSPPEIAKLSGFLVNFRLGD